MSFTSDSILKHLDRSDYPLLNANYNIAAVRVLGFCSQDKWAILFEVLMNYPSSDGIGLNIFAYGTGLRVKQGFNTPVLHSPIQWRKNESEYEEFDEREIVAIPEIVQIHIRGKPIAVRSKDVKRLSKTPEFDFDLLEHLIDLYGEELFSTDEELYLYVSKELDKVVQFDSWYHEDNGVWEDDKFHIPSYTSGVKAISQILEIRKLESEIHKSIDELDFEWTVFK